MKHCHFVVAKSAMQPTELAGVTATSGYCQFGKYYNVTVYLQLWSRAVNEMKQFVNVSN
jgi:hypothetical protein